ncbi:MAG: hypothetical protein RJA44_2516, partial [Pseudomonadota bacterium]
WPSTVAYVARLVIHRYALLGVLTEEGYPVNAMGVLAEPEGTPAAGGSTSRNPASGRAARQIAGRPCPECGNATLIHKDGCDFCTACGHVGACG